MEIKQLVDGGKHVAIDVPLPCFRAQRFERVDQLLAVDHNPALI